MHPGTLITVAVAILVVSLLLKRGERRDEAQVALPLFVVGIGIRWLLDLVMLLLLQLGLLALLLGG